MAVGSSGVALMADVVSQARRPWRGLGSKHSIGALGCPALAMGLVWVFCGALGSGRVCRTVGQVRRGQCSGNDGKSRDLAASYSDFSACRGRDAWWENKRVLEQDERAKADAIGDEPPRQRVVARCDEELQCARRDGLGSTGYGTSGCPPMHVGDATSPPSSSLSQSVAAAGKDGRHTTQAVGTLGRTRPQRPLMGRRRWCRGVTISAVAGCNVHDGRSSAGHGPLAGRPALRIVRLLDPSPLRPGTLIAPPQRAKWRRRAHEGRWAQAARGTARHAGPNHRARGQSRCKRAPSSHHAATPARLCHPRPSVTHPLGTLSPSTVIHRRAGAQPALHPSPARAHSSASLPPAALRGAVGQQSTACPRANGPYGSSP